MVLHAQPVRASPRLSSEFTLAMASSLGFGSLVCYKIRAINARFPYVSVLLDLNCSIRKLADSFCKKHAVTPTLACRGLPLFVSIRFQVLFQRPHRATFHLSLTVLVHYRLPEVFSLGSIVLPASSDALCRRSTRE